jgi:amidase
MALGGAIPGPVVGWSRRAERAQAARIGALFSEVDVLLTPACLQGPYRVGAHHALGVARWSAVATRRIAFFGAFNLTGQPACSVPAGLDDDGLPMGVQLVGRPGDEATLLSLSAQLEAERPWAARRPVVV